MNFEKLASQAERAETLLKAIANRYRLMVLCDLHQGERSVSALQDKVGLSQSSLSQHLARLRHEGFVTTRREAQTIYYALASAEITALIATLHQLYCASACPPPAKGPSS